MSKINHWMIKTADQVVRRAERVKGEGCEIICASGISPSGLIHMGNLRELMTVHLITEELLSRGLKARHLHFWDDYDRFRKVPSGMPEDFVQHLGKSLSDVPDPTGAFPSYADLHIDAFQKSVSQLGIFPEYIRQSEVYASGKYTPQIKTALDKRHQIFDILAQHKKLQDESELAAQREAYYPFKAYCESCGKDDTAVTSYSKETAMIAYNCNACGHEGSFNLDKKVAGKLVWKVDWPMRWADYQVDFEPGGEDHSTPGSSFTVGKQIVDDIYGSKPPQYVGYAFVGFAGAAKISSSAGTAATIPGSLEVIEPAIMRWLYIRKRANQSFTINFGSEILRLYDEWDRLAAKVSGEKASALEAYTHQHCIKTAAADVSMSQGLVPFRLLASSADITNGNRDQILRIAQDHLEAQMDRDVLGKILDTRINAATEWAKNFMPEDERTRIQESFNTDYYAQLDDEQKEALSLLLEKVGAHWNISELGSTLYGVPKTMLGLPLDTRPTEELKLLQRKFFVTIYNLICGKDTGPRLPTLFLSIGEEKVRNLLSNG